MYRKTAWYYGHIMSSETQTPIQFGLYLMTYGLVRRDHSSDPGHGIFHRVHLHPRFETHLCPWFVRRITLARKALTLAWPHQSGFDARRLRAPFPGRWALALNTLDERVPDSSAIGIHGVETGGYARCVITQTRALKSGIAPTSGSTATAGRTAGRTATTCDPSPFLRFGGTRCSE